MPRNEKPTAVPPAAAVVPAVVSGALMSCTVWLGPNSMPVVRGNAVVVRGAIQSGPVTLESVWVIVPATAVAPVDVPVDAVTSVAIVVPVAVVVVVVVPVAGVPVPVVAGVVVAAATPAPARVIAAPHVAAAPVLVTSTSVTMRVCCSGTVNAVTAVVPLGTVRVISTTLSTTGVPVVDGDALGVVAVVVPVVVVPVVVVPPVVVPVVVVLGVVALGVLVPGVVVPVEGVSVVGGTGVDVVSVVVCADN